VHASISVCSYIKAQFFLTLSIIYVKHSDSSQKNNQDSNHLLTACKPKVIQKYTRTLPCCKLQSIQLSSNVLQLIISYSHVMEVLEIFSFSLQTRIMCNAHQGHGMLKFYRLSQLAVSSWQKLSEINNFPTEQGSYTNNFPTEQRSYTNNFPTEQCSHTNSQQYSNLKPLTSNHH
jgi:hypothetical protein